MSHDKLPPANNPEARAGDETLAALHQRIGAFVEAFGPDKASLASADIAKSSSSPCIYLSFPRTFLEEITPEPTQRLQIEELSLFQDIYPDNITSGLENGVYIDKSSDATFASTIYKRSFDGDFTRESDPRPGDPWPLPSQDPYRASNQECDDMNAILDAFSQLDKEVVASIVRTDIA
jgi:hypothetical protein